MAACPVCNAPGFREEGFPCSRCGHRHIASRELEEGTVVFCPGCACRYTITGPLSHYNGPPCAHPREKMEIVRCAA